MSSQTSKASTKTEKRAIAPKKLVAQLGAPRHPADSGAAAGDAKAPAKKVAKAGAPARKTAKAGAPASKAVKVTKAGAPASTRAKASKAGRQVPARR